MPKFTQSAPISNVANKNIPDNRLKKEVSKKETLKYKLLILEDVEEDLLLAVRSLKKSSLRFTYEGADSKESFEKKITQFVPDVIIADFSLPSYTGLEALNYCSVHFPHIPFVFFTGTLDQERIISTMKLGAYDYVLKTNIERLPIAVNKALEYSTEIRLKNLIKKDLAQSKANYQTLFHHAPIGLIDLNPLGTIISYNAMAEQLLKIPNDNNVKLFDQLEGDDIGALKTWLNDPEKITGFTGHFRSCYTSRLLDVTLIPHKENTGQKKYIGALKDVTEQVQIENELREKNLTLENLIETIPDAVALKDIEGRYVRVNKAFVEKFEIIADEIIGKLPTELQNSNLARNIEQTSREALRSSQTLMTLHNLQKKDGSKFTLDTHIKSIIDDKNRPQGILSISRDITDYIKVQDKLSKSQALLMDAEVIAGLGSWEYSLESETLACSLGTIRLLECKSSSNQIPFTDFTDACMKSDKKMVTSVFSSAILDGTEFSLDHRVLKKNGELMWLNTRGKPQFNGEGRITKIIGTFQNITESKRIQEKMERSKELLREAQRLARVGSFDWQIDQNILSFSETFNEILILPEAGWYNIEHYLDRVHPLDRKLVRKKMYDAFSTVSSYELEHRVLLPDKSILYVKALGTVKLDDYGFPERLFGTIQDVTEERKVDSAIMTGQEMERKRIAREIHDGIGQMLAATKFNLAALDGMPSEDQPEHINKIHNTLEQSIEEASRITKNLSTKVLEELGLVTAIKELINQASGIGNVSIKTRIELSDYEPGQDVQVAIYRIIQESLNNMTKYAKASKALVRLHADTDYVLLSIADNGKGFDISDPKNKSGHGMNNLRQRVTSIHGYIDIFSGIGMGTEVQVRIPYETTKG